MKGIVFTEFLEMVEEVYSPDMVDELLESVEPASGGVYTAVGTYDHKELVALVAELSRQTAAEIPTLLRVFGQHLFQQFLRHYSRFFSGVPDAFTLLENVDGHIHVEVRKLYPDAELPKFSTKRLPDGKFEMHYCSSRPFEDLAYGLIEACAEHFSQPISISMTKTAEGAIFLPERPMES